MMNKHFYLEKDDDGIAWLHFDMAGGSANILSMDTLDALDQALINAAQMHPKGLVLLSDKPSGFLAGADIRAFAKVEEPEQAADQIRQAHRVFSRLENFSFPSLALIHGFCLGGGTELALACTYRIAETDSTRIGLPEVRLGIFPGFGGTARGTQMMGSLGAMRMMLAGRAYRAKQARRIGLVDWVVPERQLRNAASQMLNNPPPPHQPPWWNALVEFAPLRLAVAELFRHQVAKKANPAHYPAPYRLIDHWRRTVGDFDAMLESETRNVSELICGDTAQSLIRAFLLQERMKEIGKQRPFKAGHVHVVGGGVMGGDIAAWCALRGLKVTLQDQSHEQLQRAIGRAHTLFKRRLRDRRLVMEAFDRLIPDVRAAGVAHADVIIEAIFEDTAAKQALYADLEPRMRADALLATNTSSIPLETLAEKLADPTRLVGLHFFNPVAKMMLVEIVHGEATDNDVAANAAAFARQIGKLPLPVKSSPGFLVNRMLMPYLLEAVALYEQGIPGPVIDKAATDFGMPMGPIELADTVGLDICLHVAAKLGEAFPLALPKTLKQQVDVDRLGKKSGQGFYAWKNGRPQKPAIEKGWRGKPEKLRELSDRMILRMLNEAVACLREGVVADADLLDAGAIYGTGFAPFRGGPMHYIQNRGLRNIEKRLNELEKRHGEQFHADSGWHALA